MPADLADVLDDLVLDFEQIDFEPVLDEDVSLDYAHKIRGNFRRQATAAGSPWPPLKPATVAKKGHDTILVDTGRLAKASVDAGHPDHVQEASPTGLLFGENTEYGATHNDGAGNLPQREYMAIDDDTLDLAVDHVLAFAVDQLRE